MNERPILFSGPMVRAILEGRKTQTRRVMNPQPVDQDENGWYVQVPVTDARAPGMVFYERKYFHCPYGQPGDQLWVRETFDDVHGSVLYRANPEDAEDFPPCGGKRCHWKPSIFMPRWASRITLEIVGVRVERVQEITPDDARAEGVEHLYAPRNAFANLWDSINAKRGYGWDSNPWVWVVEFRRQP